jgi:hypothetical protein
MVDQIQAMEMNFSRRKYAHRAPRVLATMIPGVLIVTLAGCGGEYDSTVTGAVKLDGNVVPTGTVTFAPQSSGPTAFSLIAPDGQYSLKTGREEGLPPGQYVVSITAHAMPATLRSKDGGPAPLGKTITPDWYRDPATSGLSFEVKPGDNELDLSLTSTPPPGWKPPPKRR